jgi:hypothetical protein
MVPIQLEQKEDMKSRGLASPDAGDTLAMRVSLKVAASPSVKRDKNRLAATDHAWMY